MLYFDQVTRFGGPEIHHHHAVVRRDDLGVGRCGDADAEILALDVEPLDDDAFDRGDHFDGFACGTAACALPEAVRTFSLQFGPQQRIFAAGHHECLVRADAVLLAYGSHHRSLALHDEGDVVVIGNHVVHHPLHGIQTDDALHQTFARAGRFDAVAGQEFQHRRIGYDRQNEDEKQQRESQKRGEQTCRGDVGVPLLDVVGRIEHAQAAFAGEAFPP